MKTIPVLAAMLVDADPPPGALVDCDFAGGLSRHIAQR